MRKKCNYAYICDGFRWNLVPLGTHYFIHEGYVYRYGKKGKVTKPTDAMLNHCYSMDRYDAKVICGMDYDSWLNNHKEQFGFVDV